MAKAPKHLLALDLGTNLGWAYAEDGVIKKSGIKSLMAHGDLPGRRFIRFYDWLAPFRGVDAVYFEDVMGHGPGLQAARIYGGMLAVLQMFVYGNRVPLSGMAVSTLKKATTGHGRADKDMMCLMMHRAGWQGGVKGTMIDHDEADACALILAIAEKKGYSARFDGAEDWITIKSMNVF